jgi:hypothetical protein
MLQAQVEAREEEEAAGGGGTEEEEAEEEEEEAMAEFNAEAPADAQCKRLNCRCRSLDHSFDHMGRRGGLKFHLEVHTKERRRAPTSLNSFTLHLRAPRHFKQPPAPFSLPLRRPPCSLQALCSRAPSL